MIVLAAAFVLGFTLGMLLVAILASAKAPLRRRLLVPHSPATTPASAQLRATFD